MPDPDHLGLFHQGVEAWNSWRTKNPLVRPDLSGTDLRNAQLIGVDLSITSLRGVELNGTNLHAADLSGADLEGAVLNGTDRHASEVLWTAYRCTIPSISTDFSEANLRGARLVEANLTEANFHAAYLSGAALSRASLRKAKFDGAEMVSANFEQANLSFADLSGANLSHAHLGRADLGGAVLNGTDLSLADLRGADLTGAALEGANLTRAKLSQAVLTSTNLVKAVLSGADLRGADLSEAHLEGADLTGADLSAARLLRTNLANATLTNCRVWGISAWDVRCDGGTKQHNLSITQGDLGNADITVDNIEVAQFVYLLLRNEKIRDVIDTIGRKGVLLLGRFTEDRVTILTRLQDELRKRGYLPIIFNFDKPETKDFTETVRLLAGLSHFVIADVTNPKSAPLELQAAVPEIMVPFRPIIEEGEEPFSMLQDLWIKHRDWVFEPIQYSSLDALVGALDEKIIRPAELRFAELLARKAEKMKAEHV